MYSLWIVSGGVLGRPSIQAFLFTESSKTSLIGGLVLLGGS